jgi:Ran GTPase-activating protein (RanGAP) involved in mRNA processing and transport
MTNLILSVVLPSGSLKKKLGISPSATGHQLVQEACAKYEIPETDLFTVCVLLHDVDGTIVDKWVDYSQSIEDQGIDSSSHLALKPRVLKVPKTLSSKASFIFYLQAQASIVSGQYAIAEHECIQFAALQMQETFGDFDRERQRVGWLDSVGMGTFLSSACEDSAAHSLQERLFVLHSKLRGMSKADAEAAYLERARTLPLYGMTFFRCVSDGVALFVAVSEEGITLLDEQKRSIKLYPFEGIRSAEICENGLIITSVLQVEESSKDKEKERASDDDMLLQDGGDISNNGDNANNDDALLAKLRLELSELKRASLLHLFRVYRALYVPPAGGSSWIPEDIDLALMESLPSLSSFEVMQPRKTRPRASSRLAYFRQSYLAACREWGVTPAESLLSQVNGLLDESLEYSVLNASYCNLGDDGFEALCHACIKAVSYDPPKDAVFVDDFALASMDVSYNHISTNGIQLLVPLLNYLPSLARVNLTGNRIDNRGARALAAGFTTCFALTCIDMAQNDLGNKGTMAILEACKGAEALTTLNLQMNRITDIGMTALAGAIQSGAAFTDIDISHNKITASGVNALATALELNQSLRHLNLSNNSVGKALDRLIQVVSIGRSLKSLQLASTGLSAADAVHLAASLKSGSTLVALDIQKNHLLRDEGLEAICDAMQSNSTLTSLNVSLCGASPTLLGQWSSVFRQNNTLAILHCGGIKQIDPNVWATFCAALSSASLETVDLSECGLSEEQSVSTLTEALSGNPKITEFSLSGNMFNEVAFKSLTTWMLSQQHIKRCSLSRMGISEMHCEAIAVMLASNTTLTHLGLKENPISVPCVEVLLNGLEKNTTLEILDVRGSTKLKAADKQTVIVSQRTKFAMATFQMLL